DDMMPRIATGSVSFTPTPNTAYRAPVEFPQDLFTARPIVQVAAHTSAPNVIPAVGVTSVSASGADLLMYRTNNRPSRLTYVAMQPHKGASSVGWQIPQYKGSSDTIARPQRSLDSLQTAILMGAMRVDAGVVNIPASSTDVTSRDIEFRDGAFTEQPIVLTAKYTSNVAGTTYLGT